MTTDHYIEERNLSVAWGRAIQLTAQRGRTEVAPLVVAITGFDQMGNFEEEPRIRAELDALLAKEGMQTVHTVANTIFPTSLWNPAADRRVLFYRYERIVPRLHKISPKNRRGIYFERMISGGPKGKENQLDFAISTYLSRKGVRRSALQVSVFDPNRDHSAAARLGFPCLQHLTFAPTDGGLCVNAFYAEQYLVEKAYGNYIGICRLGRFVAHELRLPLVRVMCVTGIARCEVSKSKLSKVLAAVDSVAGTTKKEES
jgi:hypothetical protein